jgi:IMP dehydrogenase
MRFLNDVTPAHDLTYSDVFLVPTFSEVGSRMEVDLTPPDEVGTTIPITVANMTAVAGRRMAETVARRGGLAVFPQDISTEAVADMTAAVKKAHTVFDTPITLGPNDTINDAMNLINKRAHGAVIVVDADRRPVGVFTETDGKGFDRFSRLADVMSPNPLTIPETDDPRILFEALTSNRLHLGPLVDSGGVLAGVVTELGALRSAMYRPAVDPSGSLVVASAIGINGDVQRKAAELVEVGVDVLVVDTAHGHQQKMLEALRAVRKAAPDHPVVAGNVVTPEGVNDLIDAGADIIKVGVGPGAMCTTRMMTGVGRPQFSAVLECAAHARSKGRHVWADGGVRHPRDVALALAAGASSVMIGSWFAGTFEAAADAIRDPSGKLYKENYGMASARAVRDRTRGDDGFDRARKELFEEGISQSRMYIDPTAPSVEDVIDEIVFGVRSAFTYAGAMTVAEFHDRAVVGVQSATGYREGMPTEQSW